MDRVLVIGDSCEDRFTYGSSHRLCPDTPAPVFLPNRDTINAGMAGNVYENLKSFGLECDLITNSDKIIKQRYIDAKTNHTFLRVDTNDKVKQVEFNPSDIQREQYKAIVIADYCKGFLTESDISILCSISSNVFLDTKKSIGTWCKDAAFIKVNNPEFEAFKQQISLEDWANQLIVTLGDRGCMFRNENGFQYYPVEAVDVFDLSGAGDTFHAAFVAKYLELNNVDAALKYANLCASEAVQKKGVASFTKTKKSK